MEHNRTWYLKVQVSKIMIATHNILPLRTEELKTKQIERRGWKTWTDQIF